MLSENGELIMKNQDIANTCNVETIIENFKNHPSCKIIKKHFKNHITFTFRHVTTNEVKKVIHDFKNDKAAGGEKPVKILKNCGCI